MTLEGSGDMGNWVFGSRAGSYKTALRRKNDPDDVRPDQFSPTDAVPGSEEKLRVLVERSESGLPLWHPADRMVTLPTLTEATDVGETSSAPPMEGESHAADDTAPLPARNDGYRELRHWFDLEHVFGIRK